MKKLLLLLLTCLSAFAAGKISDLTITSNPSTNSYLELSDLDATPASRKVQPWDLWKIPEPILNLGSGTNITVTQSAARKFLAVQTNDTWITFSGFGDSLKHEKAELTYVGLSNKVIYLQGTGLATPGTTLTVPSGTNTIYLESVDGVNNIYFSWLMATNLAANGAPKVGLVLQTTNGPTISEIGSTGTVPYSTNGTVTWLTPSASGSSHASDKQVGTAVTISLTTTELSIFTNTIAANDIGANGVGEFVSVGFIKNNSGGASAFRVKVYCGSGVVYDDSTKSFSDLAFPSGYTLTIRVSGRGSTGSQHVHIRFAAGPTGTATVGNGTFDGTTPNDFADVYFNITEDSTAAIPFGVTITPGVSHASTIWQQEHGSFKIQ